MTTKADFTEEEWDQVREGPPAAGFVVSMAEKGGTFREAFSIAKAYAEAAKQHGGTELIDELVNSKPEVDRSRHGSLQELKEASFTHLREALAVLEGKATREEVDGYRNFVVSVAEHVANAKEEGDVPVSPAEQAVIDEIRGVLGG